MDDILTYKINLTKATQGFNIQFEKTTPKKDKKNMFWIKYTFV